MMGDFNAKVGCNNEDVEHVMAKHGTGDCNENGELLTETCGNRGLMIGGTLFPHKECHKVTWVSPDPQGRTQNQIDHISISKNWGKSLLDVRNKKGADVGSDHHFII
jgi:endonuclease/exonuclease/phosphatase family metal-dependent hydrolase